MKKYAVSLLIAVVAIFSLASGTAAQTVQGVITGTVTDPSGATVPNATVTITNAGTGVSQSATTSSDGSYRFALVPPGQYVIDVRAASFAEVKASGIVVEASQTVPFSVKLELAKGSEVIEVNEQVPLVQTATSDLSTQVDRETIQNTPLADRDVFASLPFLAPSVTPGLDLMPTSGGARESGTAYMLNGGEDNDNFSEGAINVHPPLESVQDFSIKTNQMSAEYGRGAGAVVTANQVSGTNQFHGAVYEFNRNASLNAEDFFSNRDQLKKPKYIRNQYGGIISGPIYKDKTFFSFAYDRFKIIAGTAAADQFVPTTAGLANVLANAGPIAKQILTARPPRTSDAPCSGNPRWTDPKTNADLGPQTGAGTNPFDGLPNAVGCLSFFDPETDTNDIYYGRVDHNFSSKDRISVVANIFRETFLDKFGTATSSGGPLTTNGPVSGATINHFHQISLNETHIFSPALVNEVAVSHNRHFNVGQEGNGTADTIPNILVDNVSQGGRLYQLGGDFEGGQVVGFVQDRWGATEGLNWTVGRHSMKFGGGGQYGILYRNWDLGLPGQYEFGNLDSVTGNCATSCAQITPASDGTLQPDGTITGVPPSTATSNFTNDYPYFEETSINPANGARGNAYRHYTYHDYYLFFQDDWKVSSKLTLNLGVRWDRYGSPSEVNGVLAQFTNLGCNIGGPNIAADRACIRSLRVGPASRMWPTYNKDYAPRIGFAWDPTGKGKMAIRGGYGIYYDRIFDNIWSNGAWNPPFYALLDFNAACSDAIFYSNPATIGGAYDPTNPIPHPGKRVSVRTMDQNMHDSSAHNYYFGVERQFLGSFLFRVNYQGSLGRHLAMLENYNRTDGQAYNAIDPLNLQGNGQTVLTNIRPNRLYTGFNYRSNSVNSSYNALVAEVQKRMSNGLQFQTGYTFSKLLDLNSELFAGCSTIGGFTAPYYYVSNAQPSMYRGPASYDHKHAYKFSVTYEMPFFKSEKGIVGHALGGWSIGSFYQLYAGHPIDVHQGRSRFAAQTCNDAQCSTVTFYNDQNSIPFNIGGDYNLDGVANDHPVFLGSNISSVYSGKNPADGIFKDNNEIGCGFPGAVAQGVPQAAIDYCNSQFGVSTPSTLFGNPAYPGGSTPYERFGSLGRGVFHGPRFQQLDLGLTKSFKLTERFKLDFKAQAQNILNHPDFDCVESNLDNANFGKARCLAQSVSGLGAPIARVMSLGLRLAF